MPKNIYPLDQDVVRQTNTFNNIIAMWEKTWNGKLLTMQKAKILFSDYSAG